MKSPKMRLFGAKLARSRSSICMTLTGITLIVIGLLFYLFLMHNLINDEIAKRIAITDGSESYEKWRQLPMPIYYRYYFFNITNAAEIERSGAKPLVKEIGPFTYRSFWSKNAIEYHPNGTVSFRERKVLHFVPELSVASDTERILTTVNGPLTVTLALLQKAPLVVRNIVILGLSSVSEGMFVTRNARELLYDGYPEMLTSFGPLLSPTIPNMKGKFAWLYGKNNSDDGLFTVHTGERDHQLIDRIDRYNGRTEISFWKNGSDCNRIQGSTDGQFVSIPDNGDGKSFELFHPEICRKIRFVQDHKFNSSTFRFMGPNVSQPLYDHIDGNVPMIDYSGRGGVHFPFEKYVPDPDTFSSVDDYPPNSCYGSKITPSRPELGDLLLSMRQQNQANAAPRFPIRPFSYTRAGRLHFKSGVWDMSQCKYGAPVLLSYPHFLYAHESYRENVAGMRPDPSRHQFSMLIEPRTGSAMGTYARMQINVLVSKPPWVSRYRYIPEVVFPVFWQEIRAEMPSDVVEHLEWALTVPYTAADIISIGIIVTGLAMIAAGAILLLRTNVDEHDRNAIHDRKNTFHMTSHLPNVDGGGGGGNENINNRTNKNNRNVAKNGFINEALSYDENDDNDVDVDVDRHKRKPNNK